MLNFFPCKKMPICKAKIILKKKSWHFCSMLLWVLMWFLSMFYKVHKFCFCHDDFHRCIGGKGQKNVMDRLVVPIIWDVQKCPPPNLFCDLKSNLVNQPLRCPPKVLFGDGSYALVKIPLDAIIRAFDILHYSSSQFNN